MKTKQIKTLFLVQSIVLLLGTLFAWFIVFSDFIRFYNLYGSIARIKDCTIPNPVTTPCFYGAFAFLGAFIWSVTIFKGSEKYRAHSQKRLQFLLIGSTLFALGNLFLEFYRYYFLSSPVSCSGVPSSNIFTTPCFIGSVFFLASLTLSTIIVHRQK